MDTRSIEFLLPELICIRTRLMELSKKLLSIENDYKEIEKFLNNTEQINESKKNSLRQEMLGKRQEETEPIKIEEKILYDLLLIESKEKLNECNALFSSDKFKSWIITQSFFIKFKNHIENISKQHLTWREHLIHKSKKLSANNLIKIINEAKNANWFYAMNEDNQFFNQLLDHHYITEETRKLIDEFKMHIIKYYLENKIFILSTPLIDEKNLEANLSLFIKYDHSVLLEEHFNCYHSNSRINFAKKLLNNLIILPTTKNNYHQIGEANILLGTLPNLTLIQEIKSDYPRKNINIFSITDIFSFTEVHALKIKMYQKHAWHHYYLPNIKIEMDNIFSLALAIHESINHGCIIYIHCTFNYALSALTLAVYLAFYNKNFIAKCAEMDKLHVSSRLIRAIQYIKKYIRIEIPYELIDQLISAQEQHQTMEYNIKGIEIFSCKLFTLALVQCYPFKELLILIADKLNIPSLISSEIKQLNLFLNELKFSPIDAIVELISNIQEEINPQTIIGRLLTNTKSKELIGILQRLYIGITYYLQFGTFKPTFADKLGIDQITLYDNLPKYMMITTYIPEIFSLSDWCYDQLETNMQRCAKELNECITSPAKMMFMLINLDQACDIYHIYQTLMQKNPNENYLELSSEALERVGYPIGVLLANLSQKHEERCINYLLNINKILFENTIPLKKNTYHAVNYSMLKKIKNSKLSSYSNNFFYHYPSHLDKIISEHHKLSLKI